jgi:hypothetical protein
MLLPPLSPAMFRLLIGNMENTPCREFWSQKRVALLEALDHDRSSLPAQSNPVRSDSRRASSTPGSGPTRTPELAPCRSSRRRATCSKTPNRPAAYFNLQEYGNTYSRIMNPTVAVFEERVANLEGGAGAVAFASGIAAQAAALFTLLEPGDHVVSSSALYGGTVNQLKHLLRKMSVELTWVDPDDPDAWRRAVRANTKAFFGETIGNPGRQRARHRDGGVDRARSRVAADRGQHVRDAVPVPPDRVGGRHRDPLGDQVHRRPRDEHRRRRRRGRHVQLVERTVSGDRGSVAGLPRPAVPRDVRDLRLSDEAAGRDAARSRRSARAAQRVPVPAGAGDAVAADGTSRRERASGRGVPRVARAGLERHLPGPAGSATGRSSRSTCRAARARCSRSTAPAGEAADRT